jgi:dethiobiotin synthetase
MVYGTGTAVGKTVVTAALAAVALEQGVVTRVLKPVQTGAGDDDDAATVDALVGAAISRTGWRLSQPLAPAVAARLEGRRLQPDRIVAWVRRHVGAGPTLVETAGGSAVEIVEGYDMAALGADLGYPGIVVCRPGLGTLNHTLLTVEHLRRRRAGMWGLVVNGMPRAPGVAELTNLEELPRLTGLPVLAVLPHMSRATGADPGTFARRAGEPVRPVLEALLSRAGRSGPRCR